MIAALPPANPGIKTAAGAADGKDVEKRRNPRQAQRLRCELWVDGRRHGGIVRDVSERGLFVQTRLKAKRAAELILSFPAEDGHLELQTVVRVARRDILSAHFSSAGLGGLGLEVVEGADGLGPLLESAGFGEATPETAPEGPKVRSFRVRVRQVSGPQSRTIPVRAPSLQAARARALHRAGRGWKVSEVLEG